MPEPEDYEIKSFSCLNVLAPNVRVSPAPEFILFPLATFFMTNFIGVSGASKFLLAVLRCDYSGLLIELFCCSWFAILCCMLDTWLDRMLETWLDRMLSAKLGCTLIVWLGCFWENWDGCLWGLWVCWTWVMIGFELKFGWLGGLKLLGLLVELNVRLEARGE